MRRMIDTAAFNFWCAVRTHSRPVELDDPAASLVCSLTEVIPWDYAAVEFVTLRESNSPLLLDSRWTACFL